MKCSICSKEIVHPMIKNYFGNNPYPVRIKENDRCCDVCNDSYVLPARILMLGIDKRNTDTIANTLNSMTLCELDSVFAE